jgi:PhnB protein
MGGVPLPEGYHSVNPYIVVDDAERLIGFLAEVFGAVEAGTQPAPGRPHRPR